MARKFKDGDKVVTKNVLWSTSNNKVASHTLCRVIEYESNYRSYGYRLRVISSNAEIIGVEARYIEAAKVGETLEELNSMVENARNRITVIKTKYEADVKKVNEELIDLNDRIRFMTENKLVNFDEKVYSVYKVMRLVNTPGMSELEKSERIAKLING